MSARRLIGANEVADQPGTSKAYAYKVIRKLNDELQASGHMAVAGKVSAECFEGGFFPARRTEGVRDDGRE